MTSVSKGSICQWVSYKKQNLWHKCLVAFAHEWEREVVLRFVSWRNPHVKSCWVFLFKEIKSVDFMVAPFLISLLHCSACALWFLGSVMLCLALYYLYCSLTMSSVVFPSSLGSSLRHSKERHGYCCYVCDEARAHHEVHYPCGHGRYYSHLRPGSSSADC